MRGNKFVQRLEQCFQMENRKLMAFWRTIFHGWKTWTLRSIRHRQAAHFITSNVTHLLIHQYFNQWQKKFTHHTNYHIAFERLMRWQAKHQRRLTFDHLKFVRNEFLRIQILNAMSHSFFQQHIWTVCFNQWKSLLEKRRAVRHCERVGENYFTLKMLEIGIDRWKRNYSMQRKHRNLKYRAFEFHCRTVLKTTFHLWKMYMFSIMAFKLYERNMLQTAWMNWMTSCERKRHAKWKNVLALNHFSFALKRRYCREWSHICRNEMLERSQLKFAEDHFDLKSKQYYFRTWYASMCEVVRTKLLINSALLFYNRRSLVRYLTSWKKFKILSHLGKQFQDRIRTYSRNQVFRQWKIMCGIRCASRMIQESLDMRSKKRSFWHWKKISFVYSQVQHALIQWDEQRLSMEIFCLWKQQYVQNREIRRRLIKKSTRRSLKTCWARWTSALKMRNIVSQRIHRQKSRILRTFFELWTDAHDYAIQLEQLKRFRLRQTWTLWKKKRIKGRLFRLKRAWSAWTCLMQRSLAYRQCRSLQRQAQSILSLAFDQWKHEVTISLKQRRMDESLTRRIDIPWWQVRLSDHTKTGWIILQHAVFSRWVAYAHWLSLNRLHDAQALVHWSRSILLNHFRLWKHQILEERKDTVRVN